MILSESDKAAIIADPSYIETLYEDRWSAFDAQLGPVDTAGDLSNPLLASAYAAMCGYELKPYGNELPGVVDLQGLLAEPTLACDDYVCLAMWLMKEMPQCDSVDAVAVGWDGGAVGNHAQLLVSDGSETLLLDPTIGLVVRHTSYDDIVSGIPTTDFKSLFEPPPLPDPWQLAQFNDTVIVAVSQGLYGPMDALYYYTSLEYLQAS